MHGTFKPIIAISEKGAIRARCRLKEAKAIFADRGWQHLPQTERGERILAWGADMAWLAAQSDPRRSVRRWCRRWAPWLSDADLTAIVIATETSNKRWSDDQSAAVLGVSLAIRTRLGLLNIGANDDPFYEARNGTKRSKAAARSRRYRAKHATGAMRGRPALELTPDEKLARRRAQKAESERRRRMDKKPVTQLKEDGQRDGINVHAMATAGRPAKAGTLANLAHPAKRSAAAERPKVAAQRSQIASTLLAERQQVRGLAMMELASMPTPSIGRPSRIDGDRAVNFARLRLVALSENAAEDAFPERWADVIAFATAEWRQAQRAVANGEKPVIANFGVNGFEPAGDTDDFERRAA